jgi:hypothetical protein
VFRFRFLEVGLVQPLPPHIFQELVEDFLQDGGRLFQFLISRRTLQIA